MGQECSGVPGPRVLVVEDNYLVAAELDLLVEEAGGETAALVGHAQDALTVLNGADIDGAIVDLSLSDGAGPIIAALKAGGIPFVTLAGAKSIPWDDLVEPATWATVIEKLGTIVTDLIRLLT
jgi:ActR/RegA family two-component response regulator